MFMKIDNNYWFVIEPYVYVNITDKEALLYNTLDGIVVESKTIAVIKLLQELIQKENCGVAFLSSEQFKQQDIYNFVMDIREKFMGDILNTNLSDGKPVQITPYTNFYRGNDLYIKHNFSVLKNVLNNLLEVNIYIDNTIRVNEFISFLRSLPENVTFNLIGDFRHFQEADHLFYFLAECPNAKNIVCSYSDLILLKPECTNNFSYRISVRFPIDEISWEESKQILKSQIMSYEYVFYLTSHEDYQQAEERIDQEKIERYFLKPVYTGSNMDFLKEQVFLKKEDILSTPMTLKNFFMNQAVNSYDFGKIYIQPNGDVYANMHFSSLGNIYQENIYELLQKEIERGNSWFRIRNQNPCNTCVYQWLCPSPSDLEIELGQANLCHVKSN